MGKKNVALIACTNGYGHIKRLLILSQALKQCGANPILFAPLLTAKILSEKEGILTPEIVDFDTLTNKKNWLNGTAIDWIKSAPSFSDFDIVISDNLIEILHIRPDAWLSGSFFWYEDLDNLSNELKKKSLDLLTKFKPKMISSKLFTSHEIKNRTELYEVGLYTQGNLVFNKKNKNDALISCGMGGSIKNQIREFVKLLSIKEKNKFKRVWVEPDIIPSNPPEWMVPATFNHEMYQNILVAIIRPGVGTITNSLSVGARIFPFYEYENKEMEFNASRIHSFGFADNTSLINDAWNKAELYRINKHLQKEHFKSLKNLDFEGAEQAANIILNSL